jgi:site-specific recombinase XerD
MTPIKHKRGDWFFWIPRKMSPDGKRRAVYKPSRNAAYVEIMRLKEQWRQHGTNAITDEERTYISLARNELGGDLSKLPEVLRHWRLTGLDSLTKTEAADAVSKYIAHRATQDLARKTINDSRSALRMFQFLHHGQFIHEITAQDVRSYIDRRAIGGRKSAYKQMKLFLDWAKSERMLSINPIDSIKAPTAKATEVEVYKPDDFAKLIRYADAHYKELVPFLALSGFGMMRSGELISAYAEHPVLDWSNIIWERGVVYVPEAVAKQTRRAAGNRREFPICDAIAHWLSSYRKKSGSIVAIDELKFRAQMRALFEATGVRRINNGFRKSAISHYIAAHPSDGVQLTARYAGNSESIARTHYVAWITESDGAAWFGIRRATA